MMSRRGSVLVESALTLTVILFLLYGTLELGLVGLEQLTVDGGAFATAHQDTFAGAKPWMTGKDLSELTMPHLKNADVSSVTTRGEPPTTLFAGQYGFNTPNARYGGVSMVQPVQVMATIVRRNIPNLVMDIAQAQPLSVTGIGIEPAYKLINNHFNVSGNNFNTAAAFNTAADPLTESSPPYFVGFNYIQSCPYFLAGNSAPGWTNCPNGLLLSALGSAEYLDAHNWGRANNGVFPFPRAVFWETRYHQTLFATISNLLKQNPATKATVLNPDPAEISALANDVKCVYSFDNYNIGAYPPGNIGIGDPLFQLHPEGTSPTCPAR